MNDEICPECGAAGIPIGAFQGAGCSCRTCRNEVAQLILGLNARYIRALWSNIERTTYDFVENGSLEYWALDLHKK